MAVKSKTKGGRSGLAGHSGKGVRSDLRAEVELRDGGGIDLELNSRVEAYYGESIREAALGTLAALGVEHAVVRIEDQGGFPFVIEARLEAAVRRAGAGAKRDARPERTAPPPEPSSRDRLRRSRLYLPGDEPKFMVNAGLHGSDGIILDLEDSVHADAKDAARLVVRNALRCVDFGAAERMIRINQLPLGIEDLMAVAPESPDLILIPKTEEADQVREVDRALGKAVGKSERPIWLMPILESARGIENAFEIARASDRVAALTLGLEDYTADMGVVKTREGDESLYARMRTANAASRRSTRSTATWRISTACAPGASDRARWASRGWAACIRGRSRWSTRRSRRRRRRSTARSGSSRRSGRRRRRAWQSSAWAPR